REEIVDAFTFTKFEPRGPVSGSPHVKMTTSGIDHIYREVAVTYLGREDLAHVPAVDSIMRAMHAAEEAKEARRRAKRIAPTARQQSEPEPATTESGDRQSGAHTQAQASGDSYESDYEEAKEVGYTGDSCPECGSMTMVRNGTCQRCITCGSTTGCS